RLRLPSHVAGLVVEVVSGGGLRLAVVARIGGRGVFALAVEVTIELALKRLFFDVFRLGQFRSVDPAGGHARLQDQQFGVVLAQVEALHRAGDLDPLAAAHFVAAADFVGGQVGQVLGRLHPAFAQGDSDGGGHARNL